MKAIKNECSTILLPSNNCIPLESVLCIDELHRRPSRTPDYQTENRALVTLAQALADSPRTILQKLADTILDALQCHSAGISLVTRDGKKFYWPAIAGAWRPHTDGGTPRDFGPCGDVLDRNTPLLFKHFERRYPYLLQAKPYAVEALLILFYIHGKAVGTIWAMAHDESRKFDAEDLRQLESLGRFASAAYQTLEIEQAQASRRAALNLMEDAVESRGAMEKLNLALCESEKRYRELLNALPVAVYTTDPNGTLTYFNEAAAAFVGRHVQVGKDRWCITHRLYRSDGSFMPHDECPMAVALRTGEPQCGVEAIAERSDGTRVWFIPHPTLLRDASGAITGGINVLVDITEHKLAEQALARLAAIVESSDDAIIGKNLDGIIQTWNPGAERLFGYTQQEAIGQSVTLLIPPDRLSEEPIILGKIRRGEHIDHYESVRRRKDGRLVDVSLTISPIINAQGQVVGASKIAQDITARKLSEAALIKSEKLAAAGRLAATLAHEINNPLQAVENLVDLLKQSFKQGSQEQVYANMAAEELSRITHLTRQSLSFYRESSYPTAVDLDATLEEILTLYAKRIGAKQITVTKRYLPGKVVIDSYRGEIRQVLSTLLLNAMEAVSAGGTIVVRVRDSRHAQSSEVEGVQIAIADNGVGIPSQYKARIFEAFFTTKGEQGVGLGLWVAQGIVTRLGGSIRVRSSVQPGKSGTYFSIFLPKETPRTV